MKLMRAKTILPPQLMMIFILFNTMQAAAFFDDKKLDHAQDVNKKNLCKLHKKTECKHYCLAGLYQNLVKSNMSKEARMIVNECLERVRLEKFPTEAFSEKASYLMEGIHNGDLKASIIKLLSQMSVTERIHFFTAVKKILNPKIIGISRVRVIFELSFNLSPKDRARIADQVNSYQSANLTGDEVLMIIDRTRKEASRTVWYNQAKFTHKKAAKF